MIIFKENICKIYNFLTSYIRMDKVLYLKYSLVLLSLGSLHIIYQLVLRNLINKLQISSNDNLIIALILSLLFLFLSDELALFLQTFIFLKTIHTTTNRLVNSLMTMSLEKDYGDLVSEEILNKTILLRNNVSRLARSLVRFFDLVFKYLYEFLLIIILVTSIFPPLLLVFLINIFIHSLGTIYSNKKMKDFQEENKNLYNKNHYYFQVLSDKKYAKDIRVRGTFDFFKDKWRESFLVHEGENHISTRQISLSSVMDLVSLFINLLVVYFMLTYKDLAYGDLTIGVSLLFSGTSTLSEIFKIIYKDIGSNLIFYDYYHDLNNLKSTPVKKDVFPRKKWQGLGRIDLENLSYAYPNSKKKVFDQVNISLRKGETYCLVGDNGVGKSTFIRLLTGLLPASQGTINFYDLEDKKILGEEVEKSVQFQNFIPYQLTVFENISLGWSAYSQEDHATMDRILDLSDLSREGLLGKKLDENALEVSQGQWKILAFLRAFLRDGELLIFDEPTSNLDRVKIKYIIEEIKRINESILIIVSHDPQIIEIASKVLLVEDGTINILDKRDYNYKSLIERTTYNL